MFGFGKNAANAPTIQQVTTRLKVPSTHDRIIVDMAVHLVRSGIYTSLEDAVMESVLPELFQISSDSSGSFTPSAEEIAACDDGSELRSAHELLTKAMSLSDEEAERLAKEQYDAAMSQHQKNIANANQNIARLTTVLDQAKKWKTPQGDEQIATFKRQLIDELEETISGFRDYLSQLGLKEIHCLSASGYREKQIRMYRSNLERVESRGSSAATFAATQIKYDERVEAVRQSLSPFGTSK